MSLRPTLAEMEDLFWRSLWTFIASGLGAVVGPPLLQIDVTTLEAMQLAGVAGVISVVLVFARRKLGTLPPTP